MLNENTDVIYSVAISKDSKILAAGGRDKIIRLWNINQQTKPVRELYSLDTWISSLAFSPEYPQWLASGSWDGIVRLWNLDDRDVQPIPLKGHKATQLLVAFSPKGQLLASGSWDEKIRIWDVQDISSPRFLKELTSPAQDVSAIAFSPDGNTLASTGNLDTKNIYLWDMQNITENSEKIDYQKLESKGEDGQFRSLAFSPNGKFLVAGKTGRIALLWNMKDLEAGYQLVKDPKSSGAGSHGAVAFSQNSEILAVSSSTNFVHLWNPENLQSGPRIFPQSHRDVIYSLAFSDNDQTLVSGSADTTIRVWNLQPPAEFSKTVSIYGLFDTALTFAIDNTLLFAGRDRDNNIRIIKYQQDSQRELNPLKGHKGSIGAIGFDAENASILTSAELNDGILRIWNSQNSSFKEIKFPIPGLGSQAYAIASSKQGKYIAWGGNSRSIWLWNTETPNIPPKKLGEHNQVISSLAFNSDGSLLGSGSADGIVKIWNLETGKVQRELPDHGGQVSALAFSHDGDSIASGGHDGTVRLWNLKLDNVSPVIVQGKQESTSLSYQDPKQIKALAFNHDDSIIAAHQESKILIWNSPEALAEQICKKVSRNLTSKEWSRFIGESIKYESTCPNLPPNDGSFTRSTSPNS